MARIAIGGFQHETNTFSETEAALDDFVMADAWPPLVRGNRIQESVTGINIPIAGFIDDAVAQGHDLVPLVWCSAGPSGPVTDEAFSTITDMFLEDLTVAGAIDAIYLDLHGAMVCKTIDDGEGEFLTRIRKQVGPNIPIIASLDLHANISPAMVEAASALVSYRTYPHVDMADTGRRASKIVDQLIANPTFRHFRQLPFLIAMPWQSSLTEPAKSIYAHLEKLERDATGKVLALSFTPGFPLADTPHCGPSVVGYGSDRTAVEKAVNDLAEFILDRQNAFTGRLYTPDEAVETAMSLNLDTGKSVIIADTQDNPGGGSSSDTTGMLRALIRNNAQNALLGLLHDPAAALAAHAAGKGAEMSLAIGAGTSYRGEKPFSALFRVESLGDGNFDATGPFYEGCHMRLGPMALLRVIGEADVCVAISSVRQQAADQAMFRHLEVDPAEKSILCLKSSVHFRADFGGLTPHVIVAAAPGSGIADITTLTYRKLRPGIIGISRHKY